MASLSQSIDIVSETDNKISRAVLNEKFPNTYKFVMEILINLLYYWERVCILMNTWIARKNLMKHQY